MYLINQIIWLQSRVDVNIYFIYIYTQTQGRAACKWKSWRVLVLVSFLNFMQKIKLLKYIVFFTIILIKLGILFISHF